MDSWTIVLISLHIKKHSNMNNLNISDQVINQQNGTLSLQIAGVDELKISTNLVEPSTSNISNLGNASNKFNECHQNSIHLYNGTHKTTITSASTSASTLVLPSSNGYAGAPLVTDGAGALNWGIESKTITDDDLLGSMELNNTLVASDAASNDKFGSALAISGDYAIIGAWSNGADRGSAYIYVRTGSSWSQQAKLVASDAYLGDNFGRDVSISGDYAIVGSAGDDDAGSSSGSAYIFERSGNPSVWTEQAKLVASDASAGVHFGKSVAIDGDYAIVGAYGDGANNSYIGSAYIFVRSGNPSTWTQQAKIVASDQDWYDYFGASVAISGNYVIVSTLVESVYIFSRTDNSWTEEAQIVASDKRANANFGSSFAIDGDYMVVGANGNNDAGSNSGSAYIFVRSGNPSIWTQQAKILASDASSGDLFGIWVGISGNSIIVGAHNGSVYTFLRTDNSWTEMEKITTPSGANGVGWGRVVAISENNLLVGSPWDNTTTTETGAVYVFDIDMSFTPTTSRTYIVDTTQDFTMLLPPISGLHYDIHNPSAYTVTLSGSIFPTNPTSVASGECKSGYYYGTQWLIT
jgi:hypothetical protein